MFFSAEIHFLGRVLALRSVKRVQNGTTTLFSLVSFATPLDQLPTFPSEDSEAAVLTAAIVYL